MQSWTPFSYALLGLILEEPRSGYALRRVFATTAMGHFSDSPGAVYPALRRLRAAGLIRGTIENRNSLRPREVFELTSAGRRTFESWLRAPLDREDIVRRSGIQVLKFAFMGHALPRAETIAFLDNYAQELEAYVRELRTAIETMRHHTTEESVLAMQHGIDVYVARALWARRAIQSLSKSAPRRRSGVTRRRSGAARRKKGVH
jgi:DNA-binding PadR family transcriptional regulator